MSWFMCFLSTLFFIQIIIIKLQNRYILTEYLVIIFIYQYVDCSKIWSQMIAADLYTAFQEIESNDKSQQKEMGARFRNTFLSLGGSYPAAEVFRKFRGRDPNPQALLNNLELSQMKIAK